MKALRLLRMAVVSLLFIVSFSSISWSGPPQLKKEAREIVPNLKITGYIEIECRNPHTSQDITKTPRIKNTTGKILAKGAKILWTASDGDKGTIILQKSLASNIEVQGIGKAGQVYTCTAMAEPKFLKIKPVVFDLPPKIDSMLAGPSAGLPLPPAGVLQPGSKLYIKGARFGSQPGKILIYYGNTSVELVNLDWENDTQIHGVVPMSTNGRPNQTVTIRVKTAENKLSNPMQIGFRGREEKVLTRQFVTFSCGTDGNLNVCNNWSGGSTNIFTGMDCSSQNIAVCGGHANNQLAIGDDAGSDNFNVSLKNGWVFKSVQKVEWKKTSGNEKLFGPYPPLPVGQAYWGLKINWVVSPADYVFYKLKITVEGPVGTSPY